MPPPRADWFNAWQFFGLSKVELTEKVKQINTDLEPQSVGVQMNDDCSALFLGSYKGRGYSFDYKDGKIFRVRGSIHTCPAERTGEWLEDRSKALTLAIMDYGYQLDYAHKQVEKHLVGDFNDKHGTYSKDFLLTYDYRQLRDLYIKRASLSKEVGLNYLEDEDSARIYDNDYEKSKDRLSKYDRSLFK